MKPRRPPKAPGAPSHLSAAAKKWWRQVVTEYVLEDHHVKLLIAACEHLDRMAAAQTAIAAHGLTYEDRFGTPKSRPEVAIHRDSSVAFSRILRELALDVEAPSDQNRPPMLGLGGGRRGRGH